MSNADPLCRLGAAMLCASIALACSSKPVNGVGDDASAGDGSGGGDGDGGPIGGGARLEFDVPEGERVFIALAEPSVVETDGSTLDWDLAFEGYGVYTNGGLSGPGAGASFGPLSAPTFLSDTAPDVPLIVDGAGGVFLRWYAYDTNHVLRSRFHVYGLRDGERYYKLQILSYYGERQGASRSALYTVRYAEVTEDGASETRVARELDATEEAFSAECLNLDTGVRPLLTPADATRSADWHVCFRREVISVNGGAVGPRGVEAVDLEAASTDTELLSEIRERTEESELPRFIAADHGVLSAPELAYRADGVASGFTGRWLADGSEPPAPGANTWYVVGGDGSRYLLTFDGFSGATESSPGRIALRVKAVQ